MPQHIIYRVLRNRDIFAGVQHISSWVRRHKRLASVGVALLMVAMAPFAVQALSDASDSPTLDAHQEATSEPLDQPRPLNDQPSANKKEEGQSMQHDIKIESTSSSTAQGQQDRTVDVTVNGQNVPVPDNGTVHKHMTSADGSRVDIQVDNSSTTHHSSSSSTVIIEQHSYSTGSETDNTGGTSRHPDRR